jgi:electron transfer flavoprotein beta subunit
MRGIMTARTKPLKVVAATGDAARTQVNEYALPPKKQGVKLIDAANAGELIKLLRNEAKVI